MRPQATVHIISQRPALPLGPLPSLTCTTPPPLRQMHERGKYTRRYALAEVRNCFAPIVSRDRQALLFRKFPKESSFKNKGAKVCREGMLQAGSTVAAQYLTTAHDPDKKYPSSCKEISSTSKINNATKSLNYSERYS